MAAGPLLSCTTEDYHVNVMERATGTNQPGSGTPVATLSGTNAGISNIRWQRTLNAVATATVTLPAGCLEMLEDVATWRHELTIFRNGEVVWQGPLVNIRPCRDEAILTAWDIAGWLARRVIHHRYRFVKGFEVEEYGGRRAPTEIAYILAVDGFRGPPEFEDDPGAIEWTEVIVPSRQGVTIGRRYKAFSKYTISALTDLAERYIDFTTVGRRFLIMRKGAELGRTALLSCDHFAGSPCGPEDGIDATTLAYVRGDGVFAQHGGKSDFYGLLETLIEDDAIVDRVDAVQAAADQVEWHRPPNRRVDLPAGSQLAPDAPVTIGELVPGVTVPIILDCLPQQVATDGRLVDLDVTTDSTGEQVSITVEAPRDKHADISGLAVDA